MRYADQQAIAATSVTLSWQPVDSYGEPAEPAEAVTVGVAASDGSAIVAAGTATDGEGSEPRTVTLTPAQTAVIDQLVVTWTSDDVAVATTVVDVIGRPLLTRAEYEEREERGSGIATGKFLRARREVDDKFRAEMERSWVPRFDVVDVDYHGKGLCLLPFPELREVRWASLLATDGTTETLDVTGIPSDPAGLVRVPTSVSWTCGRVRIGFVHGADRPPHDVLGAAARYLRDVVSVDKSQIPARATSWADGQGGTTQLATPGLGPFITGIPEVDQVLVARKWWAGGLP